MAVCFILNRKPVKISKASPLTPIPYIFVNRVEIQTVSNALKRSKKIPKQLTPVSNFQTVLSSLTLTQSLTSFLDDIPGLWSKYYYYFNNLLVSC